MQMQRTLGGWAVAFFLLLGLNATARAESDIVDTAYVEQALARGAIVLDARDAADYKKGHIPGAVNIGAVGKVLRDPNREDLLAVEDAEKILGAAGIDPINNEVVVYSDKGDSYGYYGLQALRYYGAPKVKVYHGGIDDWRKAGKPLSLTARSLPAKSVRLTVKDDVVIWNKDMLERLRAGNAQIVDTRTAAEFGGSDIRAIRGGHVPGAVLIPFEQNWRDPDAGLKLYKKLTDNRDGMALKDEAALRALYGKLDPDKETIVYCQSGVRASQTATVLRSLGFKDVKVYEPSWLGYAGMLSAPAENEVFINVGALLGKVGKLEAQVKNLEEELAKIKVRQP